MILPSPELTSPANKSASRRAMVDITDVQLLQRLSSFLHDPVTRKMAEQQIALVTGGNRGIGFEICRQLAKLGIRVILGARDAAKGLGAAGELIAARLPVEARELDVASDESIHECMNWIRRDLGRLDILVNNAGIMVEEDDADPEQEIQLIRDTMQTNVYGPLLLSRLAIPIMKSRRYGRIVNLSSSMGSLTDMGPGSSRLQNVEGGHQRRNPGARGRDAGFGHPHKFGRSRLGPDVDGWNRRQPHGSEGRRNRGLAGNPA